MNETATVVGDGRASPVKPQEAVGNLELDPHTATKSDEHTQDENTLEENTQDENTKDENTLENEKIIVNKTTESESSTTPLLAEWSVTTAALVILAFLAICYTLYFAQALLAPIVAAIVLALPLRPLTRWLGKFNLPPAAAATVTLLAVGFAIFLGAWVIFRPAVSWVQEAPQRFSEVEAKLRSLREPIESVHEAEERVEQFTKSDAPDEPLKVKVEQPGLLTTLAGQTTSVLLGVGLMLLVLFFVLAQGDAMLANIVSLLPTRRDRREVHRLVVDLEKTVSSYLFKVTVINIGLGVVLGTMFWLMGVPNPVLWGVMAGLLNYVPFVGYWVGAAIMAMVSLTVFESVWYAALPPIMYMLINAVEGNVITPMILGRTMSLNPIMVLLFLLIWGWMWGVVGVILAVPLLAIAKIVCDHFEYLKPLGSLMEG